MHRAAAVRVIAAGGALSVLLVLLASMSAWAGQFTVALSARRAGGGMFHLSALTVVVLDALLFGLAGRDRAGALGAAEELQELRARIDERTGVAG